MRYNALMSDVSSRRNPLIPPHIARAVILFINFFLIILAYYHIKPASRSLFIAELGADRLPYVWIGTAVVMGSLVGYYHRLLERHRALPIVLSTCAMCIIVLVWFWDLMASNSPLVSTAFYIFVDIFSVVLVEQFWSRTNNLFRTQEGKRWYGFVATGGLIGGVAGGVVASVLLEYMHLESRDLLLVASGILGFVVVINIVMGRIGIYKQMQPEEQPKLGKGSWRALFSSRYLILITGILLLAQLAQPLVEFEFIKIIEASYPETDTRTAFFSKFFSIMGVFSIAINLLVTPLVHRYLGVMAGLLAQPGVLMLSTFGFYLEPKLVIASVMKISDRGLSYSINRASKELVYIPIDPLRTYQAKAWIDMFGYRLFKVIGSVLILLLTQWLPVTFDGVQLSWAIMTVCLTWIMMVTMLSNEYRLVLDQVQS